MQTFLPFADFTKCAQVLDPKRLGKQRLEGMSILRLLCYPKHRARSKWKNHPAVRMWEGYEAALAKYILAMIHEWRNVRGYVDTQRLRLEWYVRRFNLDLSNAKMPPWLGDASLHASHRSNLLRKNEEHYSQFRWTEPSTLSYRWPV